MDGSPSHNKRQRSAGKEGAWTSAGVAKSFHNAQLGLGKRHYCPHLTSQMATDSLLCFKHLFDLLVCLAFACQKPSMHTHTNQAHPELTQFLHLHLIPTTGNPTSLRCFSLEKSENGTVISLVPGCRRGCPGRLLQGKPGVSIAFPVTGISTLVQTTTSSSSRVSYVLNGFARQLPPSRYPFPHGREQQAAAVPF